MHFVTILCSSL